MKLVLCFKKSIMHKQIPSAKKILVFITTVMYFLCSSVNAQSVTGNHLILPKDDYEIKFNWLGDSINSKWEPYSAMLIPVKLHGCPKKFYMQFDLGAPYSVLYDSKLKNIRAAYPGIIQFTDTSSIVTGLSFSIGKQKIMAPKITVKKYGTPGLNWSRNGMEIIGTIGTDMIEGKTLTINYPLKKMTVSNTIPAKILPRITLTDFMFVRNSILLPVIIKNKKTVLYFDTGSSAYELITSKDICLSLAATGAKPSQYKVKSWDKFLTANTIATNDSLVIAGQKIPIKYATFIEGADNSQVEQMIKLGMGGMTGNRLFLNNILVIDTRNRKFGITAN
jgi:hypothetical protein